MMRMMRHQRNGGYRTTSSKIVGMLLSPGERKHSYPQNCAKLIQFLMSKKIPASLQLYRKPRPHPLFRRQRRQQRPLEVLFLWPKIIIQLHHYSATAAAMTHPACVHYLSYSQRDTEIRILLKWSILVEFNFCVSNKLFSIAKWVYSTAPSHSRKQMKFVYVKYINVDWQWQ